MNTTQQEIRNEIVFISNAHVYGTRNNKFPAYGITKEIDKVLENIEDQTYLVQAVVCDSELNDAINEMNEHNRAVMRFESSFYCLGCRNKGRENFSYLCSTAHGEEHRCDNCSSTVFTTHQPTRN